MTRALVELSIATGTPVLSWVDAHDEDPRLVATALAVLEQAAKKQRRGK